MSLLAVLLLSVEARTQTQQLSVPASFIRQLDPPGTSDQFLRPKQVFVDKRFNEVFVVDTGNNRIVVFDTSGTFKFDFSGHEEFGGPTDVVVDSKGFIFVVGSRQGEGRSIFKFDYDGSFIGQLVINGAPGQILTPVTGIAIDEKDILYILTESNDRIVKVDNQGQFRGEFSILTDLKDRGREEAVLGSPRIDGELLYLPSSMHGTVSVYDLEGNLVRHIGMRGNNTGELNFPCAVDVIDHQIVVILDKHRFNALCFTTEGRFLGEFGGMGYNPGWFYHPEHVAVDGLGRIYISQVFLNRVQVCELPEFVRTKAESSRTTSQTDDKPLLLEAIKEEVRLETKNP